MTSRHEYYRGKPGQKYGIYNTMARCFQFGICEDTPMLAEARLFQMIGDDAQKWRFKPRALPPGEYLKSGLKIVQTVIDEMHELPATVCNEESEEVKSDDSRSR